MIAAVTTSRKATAGGLIAFLSPLAVLYQSEQDISGRAVVAALMAGVIGFLGVWAPSNTEPYEPRHAAPPPDA